jgi:two-component system cell cycle response regulator
MKVFIIDDILPNAMLIKSVVGKIEGVESLIFTDPREALKACAEDEPDLVIVDYLMPEMNGIEFLKLFRSDHQIAEVPVLMITAVESREPLYEALESGANDFLKKPVDDAELIARARNMLDLRAHQVELAEANTLLLELATTDGLTGVANRRHFMERLEGECARARRYHGGLTLAVIDADYFKKVNDTYGHAAGDAVLKALANAREDVLRAADFMGRLGGEEFALCLPETRLAGGHTVCERLRREIESLEIPYHGGRVSITVSIGVVQYQGGQESTEAFYERADAAMYKAKEEGRNRVEAVDFADTRSLPPTSEDSARTAAAD